MNEQPTYSARIPADIEREDRILAGLTARQVAILATAGVAGGGGFLPPPGPGPPEGVAAAPDWVAAQAAPLPAPLRLPARAISADGVIDLGADGAAVICTASTVSFALRTPQEQMALVGVFARWLHSLTGPAQILVRSEDIDV